MGLKKLNKSHQEDVPKKTNSNHAQYQTMYANTEFSILNNNENLRNYSGIVDLSFVTIKPYTELKLNLLKAFKAELIIYSEANTSYSICRQGKLAFEVEIMKLGQFYYLRMNLINGINSDYNKIISNLLTIFK